MTGLRVAKMELFNSRADIGYYQISVFDEDWNPVDFAMMGDKVVPVNHLQRKNIEVYVRERDKDKVVYICSRSKILSDQRKGTVLTSRICSKVK